jgi:hypothetical protein
MKSIYTLAAILLVFLESVLTDDNNRQGVTDLGLQGNNLGQLPNGLLNAQRAFWLIDKLCGQKGDGIHTGPSTVSGAFNVVTGEFMAWYDYIETVGQNQNYEDYLATGEWNTFYGECSLQPRWMWWEHSYKSYGKWAENKKYTTGSRKASVDVRFAGFTATTTMSSWFVKCNNVDEMANEFRWMPALPQEEKTIWQGLDRRYEQTIKMERSIYLRGREKGRIVATTVVRVVHAVQVFQVSKWYWHFANDLHGSASSWMDLGPEWERVYADLAYVEGRGICQQVPSVLRQGGASGVGPIGHVVDRDGIAVHDPCANLEYTEYNPPRRQEL